VQTKDDGLQYVLFATAVLQGLRDTVELVKRPHEPVGMVTLADLQPYALQVVVVRSASTALS